MSKKRRTKKEKIIAQLKKRALLSQKLLDSKSAPEVYQSQENHKFSLEAVETPKKIAILSLSIQPQNNYSSVLKDARQTILITISILTINLTLYFAIQNKLISLTMFGL